MPLETLAMERERQEVPNRSVGGELTMKKKQKRKRKVLPLGCAGVFGSIFSPCRKSDALLSVLINISMKFLL